MGVLVCPLTLVLIPELRLINLIFICIDFLREQWAFV